MGSSVYVDLWYQLNWLEEYSITSRSEIHWQKKMQSFAHILLMVLLLEWLIFTPYFNDFNVLVVSIYKNGKMVIIAFWKSGCIICITFLRNMSLFVNFLIFKLYQFIIKLRSKHLDIVSLKWHLYFVR